jgi:serine protease
MDPVAGVELIELPLSARRALSAGQPTIRLLARGLAAVACTLGLAPSHAQTAPAAPSQPGAGAVPAIVALPSARVIVHWRDGADARTGTASQVDERAQRMSVRAGLVLSQGRRITERAQVLMAHGISSEQLVARLARDPDVASVEIDHRLKRAQAALVNDPRFTTVALPQGPVAGQWYLKAPSGDVRSGVNAVGAWTLSTGNRNVVVAVLDTGVRFDHPDLLRVAQGGPLLDGRDFVSADDSGRFADGSVSSGSLFATSGDGDGRDADASDPGDFLTRAEIDANPSVFGGGSCSTEDSSWHGTQVSGLIAASTDNGIGIASVARNVRILPMRVLGKCGGYTSDIAAAMRWAAGLGVPGEPINPTPARVLNLSLGGGTGSCVPTATDPGSPSLRSAIADVTAIGAVVVVAAGNSAGQAVGRPANCPGAIAVAGLRHAGTKVGFSDIGPEVTLSAPGGNCVNVDDRGFATGPCLYPITSTSNGGIRAPVIGSAAYTTGQDAVVGTSFAAPMVAGAAALIVGLRPDLSAAAVRTALTSSARPFPVSPTVAACRAPTAVEQLECNCTTSVCGAGMLDVEAAVRAALTLPTGSYAPPPIPTEPPPIVSGGSGSSGGGGALAVGWLVALFAAAVALRRPLRREGR